MCEFLSYVNHYNLPYHNSSNHTRTQQRCSKIGIDKRLRIVASEEQKIQIYEEYFPLRVNRILYGGEGS